MANASNFTLGFTPASNTERCNNIILWAMKWAFIYVKRADPKNSVIAYLRVPRVRNYIMGRPNKIIQTAKGKTSSTE